MKINENYILREVAGEYIVIPVGEAALHVKGLICLSESGQYLFQHLQKGCEKKDLLEALRVRYDVEDGTDLDKDVEHFLKQLRALEILIENE